MDIFSLVTIASLVIVAGYWLEAHTQWAAHISGIFLIIVMAALLGNAGLIPVDKAAYQWGFEWAVPAADNGIDIIRHVRLEGMSILVTGKYDQPDIQEKCTRMKIPLLPKPLIAVVPVVAGSDALVTGNGYDLVLLDDDPLVGQAWQMSAENKMKKILVFSSFESIMEKIFVISKSTPIYIDHHLNAFLTGAEVAEKLFLMGYRELYLSTGFAGQAGFLKPKFVKAIVDKYFPY